MPDDADGTQTRSESLVVEQIIARALIDSQFRDRLFSDRSAALSEYELSEDERKSLDLLDRKALLETQEVALIVGATCSAYPPEDDGTAGSPLG